MAASCWKRRSCTLARRPEPGFQFLAARDDRSPGSERRVLLLLRVPGRLSVEPVDDPRMPGVSRAPVHDVLRANAHHGTDGAVGGALPVAFKQVENVVERRHGRVSRKGVRLKAPATEGDRPNRR